MATLINQMLRVIPKKQKIDEIDCSAICTNIAETGGELWEKVIYYINEDENCLDIKFKSRKGRGDLGIEEYYDKFDIWKILNYDGGYDILEFNNHNLFNLEMSNDANCLYTFDEIRLKGEHYKLKEDFYPNFFHFNSNEPPDHLEKAIQGNILSLRVDGIYTEGTSYHIGDTFSRIPELVSKDVFHEPQNVSYWEADFFVFNEREHYGVSKLVKSCTTDKFSSFVWERSNLEEIQFCYKNRIVKKIIAGDYWRYFNAEFFDNLISENWIKYKAFWENDLI